MTFTVPDEHQVADGSELLVFDPEKRRNPLQSNPAPGCRHLQVEIDYEARMVICKACRKALDPFWYLCMLAREWDQRAYRDDLAKKAHRELKQRDRDAMARGRVFARPMGGAALRAWETFTRYLGREPFSLFHRGACWYAIEEDGSRFGEDYALMQLRSRECAEKSAVGVQIGGES